MIVISLPWPAKGLSPNDTIGWRAKAAIKKKARNIGGLCALEAGAHLRKFQNVSIQVTFHPKTRNRVDTDNLISRIKPYLDGIADVIKVDDSAWEWEKPIKGQPEKGGRVAVTINVGRTHEQGNGS